MSCLNPTQAWQDLQEFTKNGKHPVIFSYKALDPAFYSWRFDDQKGDCDFVSSRYRPFNVPCGKCILCRKSRAWEVTVRALLEWQADPFQKCCFVTLTVDDEHIQDVFPGMLLRHRPWQLFAKRLRKKIGKFRYLMCGEYGEKTRRPHYHAIIYGHDLTDRQFNFDDCTYCDSPLLSDVWSNGNIQCRPVNANAIAYVAGYQLKLDDADIPGNLFDDDDEVKFKNYVRWSRMPGLGFPFLEKHPELFRCHESRFDDGKIYETVSPSIVMGGKLSFFDGRYFRKVLEQCAKDPKVIGKINEPLRLILAEKFGIMSSLTESRILGMRLHSSPSAAIVRAWNLKNRAALYDVQLARKARDVVV